MMIVKTKKKTGFSAARLIIFLFLILICLSYLTLIIWAILSSFKSQVEFIKDKLSLPQKWLFSNYRLAWETLSASGNNAGVMVFNALWLSAGQILIGQSCCICFAYVMARFNFPLKSFFNVLNVFIIMVPIIGALPSQMRIILALGLYDSPLFLLTAVGGFGAGLVIYRTAFRNVPWEFAEAGYIDGASHVRVFIELMLPQVAPLIIAQSITCFMMVWNDSITPILYLPSYPTLASGLYVYQIEQERSLHYPMLFAGCLMCAVPTVLLFIFARKYMMEINLAGGLKG